MILYVYNIFNYFIMIRLREREKAKQKRAFARANNINLGPSRKALKKKYNGR